MKQKSKKALGGEKTPDRKMRFASVKFWDNFLGKKGGNLPRVPYK